MVKTKNVVELCKNETQQNCTVSQSESGNNVKAPASEEYDRLKNEFFNNISHELRTPINVVLGSIQLFEMMGDDILLDANKSKFKIYNRIMKENCYRLLRLVNNLIDVTMMNEGNVKLYPSNHNVVTVIENLINQSRSYAEGKGLTMLFHSEDDQIVTAFDQDKISRVVLNLLSNAIKFTPEGGTIRVSVRKDEKRVYISVKDTGIGIPRNKLGHIFERFSQVDSTLTRQHEGSGIGLALSSSIVKLHGGLIRVNSNPGHGSEFIVELPLYIADENCSETIEGSDVSLASSEKIQIELSDLT